MTGLKVLETERIASRAGRDRLELLTALIDGTGVRPGLPQRPDRDPAPASGLWLGMRRERLRARQEPGQEDCAGSMSPSGARRGMRAAAGRPSCAAASPGRPAAGISPVPCHDLPWPAVPATGRGALPQPTWPAGVARQAREPGAAGVAETSRRRSPATASARSRSALNWRCEASMCRWPRGSVTGRTGWQGDAWLPEASAERTQTGLSRYAGEAGFIRWCATAAPGLPARADQSERAAAADQGGDPVGAASARSDQEAGGVAAELHPAGRRPVPGHRDGLAGGVRRHRRRA